MQKKLALWTLSLLMVGQSYGWPINWFIEQAESIKMKSEKYALSFTLNGHPETLQIPAGITALALLRDILKLKGTKEGCGMVGQLIGLLNRRNQ